MAEAIAKHLAADTFTAYSAGTEIKSGINPDAVRTIRERYGVDMTQTQRPKTLAALPPVDIVVTMGCGVRCPFLASRHREDWGLEDPTGSGEEAFFRTAEIIEQKIIDLKNRISVAGGR